MQAVKDWTVYTENGEFIVSLFSDKSIELDVVEDNFPLTEAEVYKLIRALTEMLQKRQHMVEE